MDCQPDILDDSIAAQLALLLHVSVSVVEISRFLRRTELAAAIDRAGRRRWSELRRRWHARGREPMGSSRTIRTALEQTSEGGRGARERRLSFVSSYVD